jgi:hypothetical protein
MHGARLATLGKRPAWSPAALRPLLWLDATSATDITEAAGVVASWRDKGRAGANAATASLRPTYVAASLIGGKPAVRFGAGHRLEAALALAGTDCSFFAVATENASSVANARLFCLADATNTDTGSTNCLSCCLRVVSTEVVRSNCNGTTATSRSITADTPFLYDMVKNSTTFSNALNGGAFTSTNLTATLAATRYVVGTSAAAAGGFGVTYWSGDIAELLLFDTTIAPADCDRLAGYRAHKWGQASLLPASHPYKNAPP